MADRRKILAVDFDGVIHSYEHGWRGDEIYGHVVPGFWDWARSVLPTCRLVVYSSRSNSRSGIDGMKAWISRHAEEVGTQDVVAQLEWAEHKPPAFLTIDDRAVCFHGDWSAPELSPEGISAFKPWMTRHNATAMQARINAHEALGYDEQTRLEQAICRFLAASHGQHVRDVSIADVRGFIRSSPHYIGLLAALA